MTSLIGTCSVSLLNARKASELNGKYSAVTLIPILPQVSKNPIHAFGSRSSRPSGVSRIISYLKINNISSWADQSEHPPPRISSLSQLLFQFLPLANLSWL